MQSLTTFTSAIILSLFLALPASADDAKPVVKLVTPMVFVSEYIREIGELNRLTSEARENIPNNQSEMFAHFVYTAEKIQMALGANISLLTFMRLGGKLDDLPIQLSRAYQTKGETMSELSSIASDLIAPDKSNTDLTGKVNGQLKKMPKLRALNDMVDETIGKTMTALVFLSLVDPNGDGQGHTSKLIITKAEHDELLRKLRGEFGVQLNDKGKAHWYLFAGQVLYDAIKTHKGSDEF